MSRFSDKQLEVALLNVIMGRSSGRIAAPGATIMQPSDPFSVLSMTSKAHKMNLLGHGGFSGGDLEYHMQVQFSDSERAQAARVFDDLKRNGYIQPTYDDLVDPENWVVVTDSGREYLRRGAQDHIDEALSAISPHLVELRKGMWDAVNRTSPDAARQAAHSARELISQLLKEGASAELATRKERFVHLMQQRQADRVVSDGDLKIIDAAWKLIDAEHEKLLSESHARRSPDGPVVRGSIEAAERILKLIYPKTPTTA